LHRAKTALQHQIRMKIHQAYLVWTIAKQHVYHRPRMQ
jgi:hypothetical protein